jgi:hypothetical protein
MIPYNVVLRGFRERFIYFIEEFRLPSAKYDNWEAGFSEYIKSGELTPEEIKRKIEIFLRQFVCDKSWLYSSEEMDEIARLHTYYIMLDIAALMRIGSDSDAHELYDILDI